MTAQSIISRRNPGLWLFGALILLPGALFAGSLLFEHGALFWDGTVYKCAIEALQATGNPYRFIGECAAFPLPHTHPHAATRLVSWVDWRFGDTALNVGFTAIYLAGLGSFFVALKRMSAAIPLVLLLLLAGAAGVFVSEAASGNIAIPFFGMMFLLLSSPRPNFAVVTALCFVTALFKPLYAIFLLLPLLLSGNWLLPALAFSGLSFWYSGDALLYPEQFRSWMSTARQHASEVPGFGFAMIMDAAGVTLKDASHFIGGYVVWLAAIAGLLMRSLSRARSNVERAMIGSLGLALMLPRLKEYDCLVLVPLTFALWPGLRSAERRHFVWGLGGVVIVLPALFWWGRKALLATQVGALSWTTLVDMRWLVFHQGYFLGFGALLTLLWLSFRGNADHRAPTAL